MKCFNCKLQTPDAMMICRVPFCSQCWIPCFEKLTKDNPGKTFPISSYSLYDLPEKNA